MIQQFNNSFLDQFDALSILNILVSTFNFCGLIAEVALMQLVSNGGSYFLLNKTHIGYEIIEPKKKAKEEERSPAPALEVMPISKEDLHEQKRLRTAIFEQSSSMKCVCFFQLIFISLFALTSFSAFSLNDCGINTYDSGLGVCKDCLNDLGITC